MIYRQFRKISTGEWLVGIITKDAERISTPALIHQQDLAAALSISPDDIEVVDAAEDVRTGSLLAVPGPARVATPKERYDAADEAGKMAIRDELLGLRD